MNDICFQQLLYHSNEIHLTNESSGSKHVNTGKIIGCSLKMVCLIVVMLNFESNIFISIDVSPRKLQKQFYGRITLIVYMHV